MKYHIISIYNTDYCQLKPSDPECHKHSYIIANSATEAIMEFHREIPPQMTGSLNKQDLKRQVWSVEKVE